MELKNGLILIQNFKFNFNSLPKFNLIIKKNLNA
jgi:hypothetical protein